MIQYVGFDMDGTLADTLEDVTQAVNFGLSEIHCPPRSRVEVQSYIGDSVYELIRRAMAMGFYEGVNLSLSYCDDCGHEELNMDVCPVCGSSNLTKIDRMNGYLSYSRVKGDTRLNDAKMAEIAERKSM